MKPRALAWGLLSVGGALAGWSAFARIQGDSEVVYASDELCGVTVHDRLLRGQIVLLNRGRQLAAIRRVGGRVIDGPPGRVFVTRQGSRPHEHGFWISNLLKPGQSCVAEVEVELDEVPRWPVVIELDVEEIGRSLLVHRRGQLRLPLPTLQVARRELDR